MDKYISFSTYAYGLNNPIKLNDPTGKGPEIIIKGNNITINYNFYYLDNKTDKVNGLNTNQISELNNLKASMEQGWSGTFRYGRNEYNLKTNVNFINVSDKFSSFSEMESQVSKEKYFNFVGTPEADTDAYNTIKSHRGIGMEGNILWILSGDDYKPYDDTGAHEFGHSLGVEGHPADARSNSEIPSILEPVDIINGIKVRAKPDGYSLNKVFKSAKIDINQSGVYYYDNANN